jgi:hypothetical protein
MQPQPAWGGVDRPVDRQLLRRPIRVEAKRLDGPGKGFASSSVASLDCAVGANCKSKPPRKGPCTSSKGRDCYTLVTVPRRGACQWAGLKWEPVYPPYRRKVL